jgi:hypothetical protein
MVRDQLHARSRHLGIVTTVVGAVLILGAALTGSAAERVVLAEHFTKLY